jgi:hypothetical protein
VVRDILNLRLDQDTSKCTYMIHDNLDDVEDRTEALVVIKYKAAKHVTRGALTF